jgi:transposase
MAKTINEERLRWVLPIIKKEMRLIDAATICPYGKRSLERWVAAYKSGGAAALEPKSTEPKRYRNETPIRIKERVIAIRKQTIMRIDHATHRVLKFFEIIGRDDARKFEVVIKTIINNRPNPELRIGKLF